MSSPLQRSQRVEPAENTVFDQTLELIGVEMQGVQLRQLSQLARQRGADCVVAENQRRQLRQSTNASRQRSCQSDIIQATGRNRDGSHNKSQLLKGPSLQ